MPDQDRVRRLGQDDLDVDDTQTHIWRRVADQEDADMGLINYIELPRGEQLQTGVNLDYEEQQSFEAIEESEELWIPSEFPPELVKAGKDQELESMRSFGVYRLVPLSITTQEEQRYAIPTRWVETWKGDKVKCRLVAMQHTRQSLISTDRRSQSCSRTNRLRIKSRHLPCCCSRMSQVHTTGSSLHPTRICDFFLYLSIQQ